MQLQKQTISIKMLNLLKYFMADDVLSQFALAGETALSLQIGHRQSMDLDLFSATDFNSFELDMYLDTNYNTYRQDVVRNSTLMCNIDGIKVDFVTFKHNNIEPFLIIDNIRLYSLKDIVAMKLFAISINPARLKDYIDIAYLSKHFSFNEMLDLYSKRYPNRNSIQTYKMLCDYSQIKYNEPIKLQNSIYKWENIDKRLIDMRANESKIFETYPQ